MYLLDLPDELVRRIFLEACGRPTCTILARRLCKHTRDLFPALTDPVNLRSPLPAWVIQLAYDYCCREPLRNNRRRNKLLSLSAAIAHSGDLANLRMLRQLGCYWNSDTCYGAAASGNLAMVQWLHERCPGIDVICEAAAGNGHLHILKWAHENGCPWGVATCENAADNGHLEVLKYAREQDCPWDDCTVIGAIMYGHPHVLQWALDHECPWGRIACSAAARYGKLEFLQWAHANGYAFDDDDEICPCAAAGGHRHVVEWAIDHGCTMDESTCARAADHGHLELLQWLRMRGCPWDRRTLICAVRSGHLEVAKWVRAQYAFPWRDRLRLKLWDAAKDRFSRSPEAMEWLHSACGPCPQAPPVPPT